MVGAAVPAIYDQGIGRPNIHHVACIRIAMLECLRGCLEPFPTFSRADQNPICIVDGMDSDLSGVDVLLEAAGTTGAPDSQVEESHNLPKPSRRGAFMLRSCACCGRGFKPLSRSSRGHFHNCDVFCSLKCSSQPVLASTHVAPQPTPKTLLQRVRRQVKTLRGERVSAVFGARVASDDGRSNHVVIAAQDPAIAVIVNTLLLGSAAGASWAGPLQAYFAEACINGRAEGFQNYFASQLEPKAAEVETSGRKVTGAVFTLPS